MRPATSRRRRQLHLSLLALWAVSVALLTLTPFPTQDLTADGRLACPGCGPLDVADLILNWVLFVPAGVLLTLLLDARRALAVAVAVTLCIEGLQLVIPGRDPALHDVLVNSLGGVSGILFVRRGFGPWAQRALVLASAVAWLAPVALLHPVEPSGVFHALWTPHRDGARYRGRLLAASVGGLPIPTLRIPDDLAIGAAIADRASVSLRIEVGPSPHSFVNLLQIVEEGRGEVLTVGLKDDDVLFRAETVADRVGLHPVDARWAGGAAHLSVGDTVDIAVERGAAATCMTVDGRRRCGLAPGLADGWGHLIDSRWAWRTTRRVLRVLWPMGLGFLIGVAAPGFGVGVWGAAIVGVLGNVASGLTPDVRPDLLASALVLLGGVVGAYGRPWVSGGWTRWFRGAQASEVDPGEP